MRKRRQQFGGVYLDPRSNIWYYRRKVNGKRQLTRIGKLSEYPTKALAKRASQTFVTNAPQPASPSFENAARRYMAHRMPTHPPTADAYATTSRTTAYQRGAVLS